MIGGDAAVGEADHREDAAAAALGGRAAIASASARVFASGFSHSTCLPASSAAIAISACASPGAHDVDEVDVVALDDPPPVRRASAQPEPLGGSADAVRVAARHHGHLDGRGRSKTRGAVRHAWEWAAPMKP